MNSNTYRVILCIALAAISGLLCFAQNDSVSLRITVQPEPSVLLSDFWSNTLTGSLERYWTGAQNASRVIVPSLTREAIRSSAGTLRAWHLGYDLSTLHNVTELRAQQVVSGGFFLSP